MFLWDLQIFRFANGLISIKEVSLFPLYLDTTRTGDKRRHPRFLHRKLLLILLLLLLVRLPSVTVKCKRDRSTHRRHVGTPFYSSYAALSVYFWSAISLLRTMACCAGIRLEATSVLLESQHPRAGAAACAPEEEKKKKKKKKKRRNGASTVAPESIWIHGEGFWLAAAPSDHPRGRRFPRRRDVEARELADPRIVTQFRNFEVLAKVKILKVVPKGLKICSTRAMNISSSGPLRKKEKRTERERGFLKGIERIYDPLMRSEN